ncbi:MAG: glycosyltransferase family 4 protein [Candidatus Hodarchaeota archaeon]
MVILFITSSFLHETYGGVQYYVLELSHWLNKKNIDVIIITNSINSVVKKITLKRMNNEIELKKGDNNIFKYVPSFLRSFIYAFMSFIEIINSNKKISISILHAQDVFISGLIGMMVKKLLKIPLVIHAHGPSPYFYTTTKETTKIQRIFAKFLVKIVVNNSNILIATDPHTKNFYVPFINKSKIVCIPTPINIKSYYKKRNILYKKILNENLILGFIGRLSPQKNLQRLLVAFNSVIKTINRQMKLFIIGDGPERNILIDKVKMLNLKNDIIFTGNINEEKKIELLDYFDIFIMPSLYEGCPVALLEAMAFGKAIIASNIPSIKEIVTNNKEAILIDPHNIEELKKAILFLSYNSDIRKKLGLKAKKRVKYYDIERINYKVVKIYKNIISKMV